MHEHRGVLVGVRFLLFLGAVLFFQSPVYARMSTGLACTSLFEIKTTQALNENTSLRIATWNIGHNDDEIKTDDEIDEIKPVLKDINADIYVFQELLGMKDLNNIVSSALNNSYEPYLIKGNDRYGVEIGFAVRKGMDVSIAIESNRNLRWTDPNTGKNLPAFTRDLPILYLRQNDGQNVDPKKAPDLIVIGVHLKSRRGWSNTDLYFENYRTAQADMVAQITMELQKKFPNVRIVIAGDFQGDVSTQQELMTLRSQFLESLTIMGNKLSTDQKVTHTFHPSKGGRVQATQTDGLFVNLRMAKSLVQAFVYHFKNFAKELFPRTRSQRDLNPSDHMPVIGDYDMTRP